jgi:hypothetical protein
VQWFLTPLEAERFKYFKVLIGVEGKNIQTSKAAFDPDKGLGH